MHEFIVIQLRLDGDDPSIFKIRNGVHDGTAQDAAKKFIDQEGDETISEYDIIAVVRADRDESIMHFKPIPPKEGWTVEAI